MVICKFFLQGTCKFGEMCKFQHDLNENFNNYQNSAGSSILRNSTFGGIQPQPKINQEKSSSVDTNTLIKSVVSDMTQAEKKGQWLFSCYAPYKEKPGFPGFEDQSFEEIRLAYYEAVKAGTVEQFKQQIQGMVQEVLLKVRSLQNPSPDIVNMLVGIYNTAPSPQAGIFSGNSFTNTNTANFSFKSGAISQQPIFAQANQNIFANATQQPQQQQQSIFNSPSGNSIFGGNNQNTGSIFTGNNQNTQMGIFANQSNNSFQNATSQVPTSSNNIFAQANNNLVAPDRNSLFQPAPVTPIFSNNQATNSNIFAQQNPPNLFQPVSQAPSNLFGPHQTNPNNNNIFNTAQTQQNSVFTQPPINTNSVMTPPKNEIHQPQAHTNNIFGNNQNAGNPLVANTQPTYFDENIYSKLEDLTEEEIKWFESDDLDVTKIPEKPPTYQMCFKL